MYIIQAATHEKALADKDAVEILLNAILLKYAGKFDEARKKYHTIIRREAGPRNGVTCH